MPILNFKKQFAPKVKAGEKTQTIRAIRKEPIFVGDTLFLYTGLRTKYTEKLGEGICIYSEPITITEDSIVIAGLLQPKDLNDFAIKDGFNSWEDFVSFFRDTHGLPFNGEIYRWELKPEEAVIVE